MGRVFTVISLFGTLILAVIVILAILSITGEFEPRYTNPPN